MSATGTRTVALQAASYALAPMATVSATTRVEQTTDA